MNETIQIILEKLENLSLGKRQFTHEDVIILKEMIE